MALEAEILGDLSAVEGIVAEWDRLAVGAAGPYRAPGWGLSWWRHVAPAEGALRVIAAREDDRLVGVVPLWATRGAAKRSPYELLGARLAAPTGPLALPGREAEVASVLVGALAGAEPRPSSLELEGVEEDGWPAALAAAWPRRRAWRLVRQERPLPTISIGDRDYDGWLGGKSSKFRQEARRRRRRLDELGARFSVADRDGLESALVAFERLHRGRWEGRGGSDALVSGLWPMLLELAAEWLETGRLRVYTLEIEDEVAAARIMVAAGGAVEAWNTGFDERWSQFAPSLQLMLHAVGDAAARGDAVVRLGGGGSDLKLRLADSIPTLSRETLVPRDAGYPLARLRLAPAQARRKAGERIPDAAKSRLRALGRRR